MLISNNMETSAAAVTGGSQPIKHAMPLRRATYVNVDKLVRSQYDIDLKVLTAEIAKLKSKDDGTPNIYLDDTDSPKSGDANDTKNKDISSPGSPPVKPNAWATTNLSVLPTLKHHTQTPLSGKFHQSRLQPPRDGFNLCLLVGKVELVVDKYRVDGSRVLVAEGEVGDETGSISLRARDEQIDLLRKVSNDKGAIVLRNCTMELYQGKHLRLGVSKWGKMSVYPDGIESTPDPPLSMNKSINFSIVDLNVVAQPRVPEISFPVSVATVHHRQPKKQQYHTPKKTYEESSRGSTRNRGRQQVGRFIRPNPSQDYSRQQQHKHHHQQRRPRSGSHLSATGNQHLLYHSQTSGGSISPQSPMHYYSQQQYSDAGSVSGYSYQSQELHQGSPSRQQFLPEDHYNRQQQMFYHYDLQHRHAQQMQSLQQQHEVQRRMLEQQQAQALAAQSGLIPESFTRADHSQDYPAVGVPEGVSFPYPPPSPEYPWQQQHRDSYATISPPTSPPPGPPLEVYPPHEQQNPDVSQEEE